MAEALVPLKDDPSLKHVLPDCSTSLWFVCEVGRVDPWSNSIGFTWAHCIDGFSGDVTIIGVFDRLACVS